MTLFIVVPIIVIVILMLAQMAWDQKKRADFAEAQWSAWREASIDALATWVKKEHGENGEKAFRQFTRYSPPEVVLETLPRAPDRKEKSCLS